MVTRVLVLATITISLLLTGLTGTASAGYEHLLASESACPGQSDAAVAVAEQEKAMLCMVNFARRQSGVAPLSADALLMDAADRKAQDILRCQAFSHTACGREFTYHIKAVGYPFRTAGENIAWGSGSYGTVRRIMTGWLNSTGHRTSLLSASFADQGIGLVKGTFSGYAGAQIWVNQFAKR